MSARETPTILANLIVQETARNRKAARMTWILGLVFVAILTAYMTGLLYLVRGILEPTTAARMIAQKVEADIPALMRDLEQQLRHEATPLANEFSRQIMSCMPQVRLAAQDQIDRTYQEWLPVMRDEMAQAIHSYVVAHRKDLEALYAAQKEPGFAKVFVDDLTAQIVAELNRHLRENGSQHDLVYVHDVSLNVMKDINRQLTMLMTRKAEEMTRSERLQRRLIVSWVQVLNELLQQRAASKPATVE